MFQLKKGDVLAGQYELVRLIDTGGFADVWEATYRLTTDNVALKIYPRLDEVGLESLESEYKALFRLQHEHLVKALHFDKQEGYPFLVMVFYEGGNASKRIGEYTEKEIGRCLYEMSGALQYLHSRKIVHKDIKPNNFLMDGEGSFYLADLGLSGKVQQTIRQFTRPMTGEGREKTAGVTPPQYRAPELWKNPSRGQEAQTATDIWALGASLYEMITGDMPFGDLGGRLQMSDPYMRPLPAPWPEDLNTLIAKCLDPEPAARPTAAMLEKWAGRYLETGKWKEEMGTVMPWPKQVVVVPEVEVVREAVVVPEAGKKKSGLWVVLSGVVLATVAVLVYLNMGSTKKEKVVQSVVLIKDSAKGKDSGQVVKAPTATKPVTETKPSTHKHSAAAGKDDSIPKVDPVHHWPN